MSEPIECGFDDEKTTSTTRVRVINEQDQEHEVNRIEDDCSRRDLSGRYFVQIRVTRRSGRRARMQPCTAQSGAKACRVRRPEAAGTTKDNANDHTITKYDCAEVAMVSDTHDITVRTNSPQVARTVEGHPAGGN